MVRTEKILENVLGPDVLDIGCAGHCYNQRQLYKQDYPQYPAHVFQFVAPS